MSAKSKCSGWSCWLAPRAENHARPYDHRRQPTVADRVTHQLFGDQLGLAVLTALVRIGFKRPGLVYRRSGVSDVPKDAQTTEVNQPFDTVSQASVDDVFR